MPNAIKQIIELNKANKYGIGNAAVPNELPEVTADDNGKFLGVDSGEWKAVSAPSGGGGLVVNVAHEDGTELYTADTKAGVIFSALEAGQYVRFQTDYGTAGYPDIETYSFSGYVLGAEAGYMFAVKDHENVDIILNAATANDYPATAGR